MTEPDETRRIDFEVLAWMLAAGVVGLALKFVPGMLAWAGDKEEFRSALAWHLARELALVVIAVPAGIFGARATRLGARDVRAWLAREPRAGRRIAMDLLIGLAAAAFLEGIVHVAGRGIGATIGVQTAGSVALLVPTSIGAGLNEEIVFRLGVMTFVTWIAVKATRRPVGWGHVVFGLLVSALAFGAAHLPMPWIDTMRLIWNEPIYGRELMKMIWFQTLMGLVCGALYWKRGIVAPIAAHSFANVYALVIAPALFS